MASVSVESAGRARSGEALLARVAEHGTASHAYFASESLVRGPEATRNLADAIHFLCALHGRHPGIVDHAARRVVEPGARAWLNIAAEAMAAERASLTRLSVAVGGIPSTPGGAGSETAILAQRAALATLALSDRRGCALGAALAFAADWASIRIILDAAAKRLGVDAPPSALAGPETLQAVADEAGEDAAARRALLFGAEQLALQHRGLWDLLEARQQARREY
ncbi:MAG TPA: hypothetical protein VEX35_00260 [Allosphingosinicella sp.]|nr:hypothetical protein [Allosphingosinicella sp.]